MLILNCLSAAVVGVAPLPLFLKADPVEIRSAREDHSVAKDSLVRALIIDGVRLRLDSTMTLKDAQKVLGRAAIHAAKNHDDVARTCYQVRVASGSVYLQLESDDIGGPEHRIMGFQLSATPPKGVPVAACSTTKQFRSIATDNGLFVGMPMGELLGVMRTPKEHIGARYKFEYSRSVRVSGERPYDIGATLGVETEKGRVVRLTAWYAETS
jgi:hypothetical protein